MAISSTREQRRKLARNNAKQTTALREVHRNEWPNPSAPQLRVLRSRDFLVQEFIASPPALVRQAGEVLIVKAVRGDVLAVAHEWNTGATIYPGEYETPNAELTGRGPKVEK